MKNRIQMTLIGRINTDFIWSFIVFCFIFCSSCYNELKDDKIKDELNLVLTSLLEQELAHVSVVQKETKLIYKVELREFNDAILLPSPPNPAKCVYHFEFFEMLVESKYLNLTDAKFMFSQIDSTKSIVLNDAFIQKEILPSIHINELFYRMKIDSAYEYLYEKYGSSCFISSGYPLFNRSFTKCLLPVDEQCGGTNGQGGIYLFGKREGKWYVIERFGLWVS